MPLSRVAVAYRHYVYRHMLFLLTLLSPLISSHERQLTLFIAFTFTPRRCNSIRHTTMLRHVYDVCLPLSFRCRHSPLSSFFLSADYAIDIVDMLSLPILISLLRRHAGDMSQRMIRYHHCRHASLRYATPLHYDIISFQDSAMPFAASMKRRFSPPDDAAISMLPALLLAYYCQHAFMPLLMRARCQRYVTMIAGALLSLAEYTY